MGTLLIHTVLLILYVSPVMVFCLDIMLTKYNHIDAKTHVWLMAANSKVLMMLLVPCSHTCIHSTTGSCWGWSGATFSPPGGTVTSSPFLRATNFTVWQAEVKNYILDASAFNYHQLQRTVIYLCNRTFKMTSAFNISKVFK